MRPKNDNGFPRRRVLRGVLTKTKGDLLSLTGAFATAVSLGLATEIFPDQAGADLGHRIVHGLVVVVGTLAAVSLADMIQRCALYRWRSRRFWTVRPADHMGLLGFGVDSRRPMSLLPDSLHVVVRKPSGEHVMLWPDPALPDDAFVVPYPPGRWVHLVEQPYAPGRYEVRAYASPDFSELTRATFDIAVR